MSWQFYQWVWQLGSPFHIGLTPAGALNRTRLYIPARALWGALTAELARRRNPGSPDYRGTGDDLRKNCRFSYLFPAQQVNGCWLAWLPRYEEGHGLVWRREDQTDASDDVPDRVFRSRLLTTRPGTAIDPSFDSAAEGSLREYEVINHWCRWVEGEDPQPVAFVGYVLLANGAHSDVLDVEELFIGGDTRYGLGRVQKVECASGADLFGKPVDLTGNDPAVQSDRVWAHVLPGPGVDLFGTLELLAMWDYGVLKAGQLGWAPGSGVRNNPPWWRIRENGLWEIRE